jgi:hypothetical protein
MDDPTALFHQYEQDYCNKSTEISRKISALTGVATGEGWEAGGAPHEAGAALTPCQAHTNLLLLPLPAPDMRRGKATEIESDMREADSVVRGPREEAAARQHSRNHRRGPARRAQRCAAPPVSAVTLH